MKTEVKFRELPEKVQGFLLSNRIPGNNWDDEHIVKLDWLHNLVSWKYATDDERLAYAQWRYPVGTVAIDSEGESFESTMKPFILDRYQTICVRPKCHGGAVWSNGKWAEIVSLPDIKEATPVIEEPKGIYNFNPDAIRCSNNSKEPKAGDMVEGSWDEIEWEQDLFFTGGKSIEGSFICQNSAKDIRFMSKIRLPQKSEVESAAEKHSELQEGTYTPQHKITYKHGFIDGAKWGQANPGKI